MIISAEPETSDSYVARVLALVHDPGTRIYFDTSFLLWLAKLGRAARVEFFDWVSGIDDQRFHVPVWSAHEYFKHQMKGTVEEQFKGELSSFDSAARRFYKFARSFCSPELFGSLLIGKQFVAEFQTSVQRIRAMLELAKKGSQTEIDNGLKDVAKFIDAHLIDTPLFELIDGIDNEERVRNRGRVPPSFQDAHKQTRRSAQPVHDAEEIQTPIGQDNSFGDLVIWKEILAHAKTVKASAVILATNDRKNDWYVSFKGDKSVSPSLRRLSTHIPAVPMPHPLLQREAKSCVPIGGLTLIDSPYMGALVYADKGNYKEFAAVAFDAELPSITKDVQANAKSWAFRFGSSGAFSSGEVSVPIQEVSTSESSVESLETEKGAEGSSPFDCDDFKAPIADCSEIARSTIEQIVQADLAERSSILNEILWDALGAWSPRDLLILGREIFRLADGGDPVGEQFLRDFRGQALLLDIKLSHPIFVGMLMALYFDQSLERREPSGRDTVHALLDLLVEPALLVPAAAVGELLEAADPKPLFVPGSNLTEIALQVTVESSADGKSPADLAAVQLDGHDLITDTQPEPGLAFGTLLGGARDVPLGAVLDLIARYHLLPRRRLNSNQNPDSLVRLGEMAGIELDV